MALQLRHRKGLSGSLLGSVKAIPGAMGTMTLAYVSGSAVMVTSESPIAPQQVLQQHDERITAFAMSHSGTMMASGQQGQNSDVVCWDVGMLAPKFRFQEHDVGVAGLAFSLDDRLLVSVGHAKDQKVYVLDTATGKIVAKAVMETNKDVRACAWAPGPQGRVYTFATATVDADIVLWTLDPYAGMLTGQKVNPGSIRREYTTLCFSADGQWLYAGTSSADVVTINVARVCVQMAHPVCSGGVGAMLLNAQGQLIVAGRDGALTTFNHTVHFRELRPFVTLPGPVTSLSASADGSALIAGTSSGSIYRLASGSLQISTIMNSHQGEVVGVSFAPGMPDVVATCSDRGDVCVWSTQDYSLVCRAHEPSHIGAALCVALTADTVISGWADGSIRCHALAGGGAECRKLWEIPGAHALAHSVGVTSLVVSNRGSFFVTGGMGGEIRAWDMRSREMAAHMKLHTGRITSLAVMGDDVHVLAASEDRSWSLWDIHAEKMRTSWRTQAVIRGLAVSPDKVSVATVSCDKRIQLWDVRTPEALRTILDAHAAEVGAVAFDNRGGLLATGGADHVIKVFAWQTGREVAVLGAHTGPIAKLAFSPDDRVLVSVALDGSICFWDVAA